MFSATPTCKYVGHYVPIILPIILGKHAHTYMKYYRFADTFICVFLLTVRLCEHLCQFVQVDIPVVLFQIFKDGRQWI